MEVPFSHASPAKRVAGESEEQQSERTGDFSKKNRRKRCVACDELAERVGFEPTDGFTRQTISSRSRYDLFDTAPYGLAL